MKPLPGLLFLAACGGSPTPAPSLPTPDHALEPMPKQPTETAAPAPKQAVGKPRTDLIPRSLLFGNPERVAVRLSPDGKQLSWMAPKNGVMNIWVAPIDKLDQAKAVTDEKTRPIPSYSWAFTGKHLLYQQDVGGDENFHVFKVDLSDGKTVELTPSKGARAEIAGLDHKSPNKIWISINDRDPAVFDLHEYDLTTGKRTLVMQNDDGYLGFTLDNANQVRLANKKNPDGSTQLMIREGKAWKAFDTIPFEDAETTGILGFTPDNKSVYATESRGRDTAALVEMSLATRKQKVLGEHPKADVGNAIVHPTKHTIQAVAFDPGRVTWKILDKSIEKDLAALAKLDDGADVNITSRTLDDKKWIVATSSDRKASYYLWDRAAQKATFLFSPAPKLYEQPLSRMSTVTIPARDGLELVSYLTLPKSADPDGDGKANSPVPMVLFVHGGPWARDDWGFNPVHQQLANRGYAVLSVNYRGSTGFGKKFLNAANLQWGKTMHDDLIDAVAWSVKQGISPKDKICIAGGSYGGYATLAGLTMTPDVFACGVDIVGPSNLMTLLASIPPYWAPFLAVFHTRMGNPTTDEGKALLLQASPLTHTAKISRPLLIGQGANDPRVKQAESEQIVTAMKKHNLPVTYVLFPDEGHGFHRPENNIAFFAVMEAFLSAHLGGFYQPITTEELKASTMQIKDGKQGIPGL
ncbi:MAG: S9 family peptidase [Deltaproteobacteria bacterium]|nr:S9 family peptidase [Deltaproteobacteria bacterium]